MLNTVKKRNKEEKAKYRIPKKVQDLIPIQTIWNDGIFKTDNKYSKTYRFTDINFQVASETDKQSMLEKYAKMICSIDSEATIKLTVNNRKLNKEEFEEEILLKLQGDKNDVYRKEYNREALRSDFHFPICENTW